VLSARDLLVRRGSHNGSFELRIGALDLQAGGVLAVLGPNGAGKSTLLRALAGLEAPLHGHIERHVEGPVTMVFQRPIAFSGSVAHNLRTALSGLRGARALSRSERSQRVEEALEHFDIARLSQRRAATLSGGELRRLALARAFALRPAVLLLDEPFDDLDTSGQETLSLDLRRAIVGTDVAVAVVTHDLRRALLLSDRIAVLIDGALAQQGERDQVLARPTSVAVARLVGMSNLIPAKVSAERSGDLSHVIVVDDDGHHRIPVLSPPPGLADPEIAPGTRVWAGIRPERLKLDVGRGEGLPIGKGVVRTVVSDGVAVTVLLDWAGHELRTHLLAGRGLARTVAPGDSVTLTVRPEDVHLIPLAALISPD
jgi:ABC-type sulfate/molybdate transport systems ATPase subunit